MRLIAKCPKCGFMQSYPNEDVDRRRSCSKCGNLFKIPDAKQLANAAKVLDESNGRIYLDQTGTKTYA